jgi:hypothetical protein
LQVADFCREIESYLCRKNDGHLIRVTGPSFDLVAGWAKRGIPIKVACKGIDRSFERYYRNGPRRRPVKIDFCEADVLDVFDEWQRAMGVSGPAGNDTPGTRVGGADARVASLPRHLERVVLRLTDARTSGLLDARFDVLIDRASAELDAARTSASGLRGTARQALIERLEALDAELLQQAHTLLDDEARDRLIREADEDLAPFRGGMSADALARARTAAIDRLVRERYKLPLVAYRQL